MSSTPREFTGFSTKGQLLAAKVNGRPKVPPTDAKTTQEQLFIDVKTEVHQNQRQAVRSTRAHEIATPKG